MAKRLRKDVGEGEAGPMMWVGSDVHVDIPGGGRRNRKRPGIAAAPSVHKASFRRVLQKVLDSLWDVPGFVFKNDTWPPATPAPTGGGGSGPTSARGSLVPVGMDVRHTGSPPKGVRWQKLPRQGGQAPGGGGSGAIQGAMDEPCKKCYT